MPAGNETANITAGEPQTMIKYSDLCLKQELTPLKVEEEFQTKCERETKYCGLEIGASLRCERSPNLLDFIYDRR